MVYVAGKGDGNVRYYEVTRDDDRAFYLSQVSQTSVFLKNLLRITYRYLSGNFFFKKNFEQSFCPSFYGRTAKTSFGGVSYAFSSKIASFYKPKI